MIPMDARRALCEGTPMVSALFDDAVWLPVPGFEFGDITYHRARDVGAVRNNVSEVRDVLREANKRRREPPPEAERDPTAPAAPSWQIHRH